MPAFFAAVQAFGLILAAGSGSSTPLFVAPPPAAVESVAPAAAEPETSSQPEKPAEKKDPPAKTEPEKKEPPADPSTEDVLKEMEKQRGNAPAPTPSTAPPAPAPAVGTPQPAATVRPVIGRLLREGTFLVDRRGRMVRATNGEWTYAFDADAQNQADPTMILMPCQRLEAMEKLAERYGESVTFSVTGQVFVYKNRNYLLPGPFRVHRAGGDLKSAQ